MRALLVSCLCLAAGCAAGPGEPFAVLSARVRAGLDRPAGRDAGDGFQRLSNDYQVNFTALRLEARALELVDLGSGATLAFDPANPPEGYGLCHNGHCHRDDGALVDYAVISAEVTGGSGPSVLSRLPLTSLNVLAGEDRALDCGESCELPLGKVGQVRLELRGLTAEGLVRDGRVPARIPELPFRLEATLPEGSELSTSADVEVSRHLSPRVGLTLDVGLGPRLLDGVPFDELPAYPLPLDAWPASIPAVQDRVRLNLAETALTVSVER
ncbi:MAG: hypothetical protein RL653_2342 [Pseudomonadota bacterium]|jgi:hypothetical protein